jgi:stearoyl-CoA desaturase (Delta-9 desaturase)
MKTVTESDSAGLFQEAFKPKIKWNYVLIFIYMHAVTLYTFSLHIKISSVVIMLIYGFSAGLGISSGAHRLFTHQSYKANRKLTFILATLQTMFGDLPIINWCRNHHSHHKYVDTDADPFNSRRGIFFTHGGYLLLEKHPEVNRQGKKIDISYLNNDPILAFQKK